MKMEKILKIFILIWLPSLANATFSYVFRHDGNGGGLKDYFGWDQIGNTTVMILRNPWGGYMLQLCTVSNVQIYAPQCEVSFPTYWSIPKIKSSFGNQAGGINQMISFTPTYITQHQTIGWALSDTAINGFYTPNVDIIIDVLFGDSLIEKFVLISRIN